MCFRASSNLIYTAGEINKSIVAYEEKVRYGRARVSRGDILFRGNEDKETAEIFTAVLFSFVLENRKWDFFPTERGRDAGGINNYKRICQQGGKKSPRLINIKLRPVPISND